MPLNKATFRTRAWTALVFCLVMLAGLLIGPWSFFILFSIIHFGCWVEFQKLVGKIDPEYATITPFHKYGVMIAGWCLMLYFTNDAFTIFWHSFTRSWVVVRVNFCVHLTDDRASAR